MSARNDLYDLSNMRWVKSSYSGGDHGTCVEVATDHPGVMPVRDSKNPDGPALVFPHTAWTSFIEDVKAHD